jgi:hypothetical protein
MIPKLRAVGTLYYHLALAIAVHIRHRHHVVLSFADVHVRAHLRAPKESAIAEVSLHKAWINEFVA